MGYDSIRKGVDDYLNKKNSIDEENSILCQDELRLDALSSGNISLDSDIQKQIDSVRRELISERRRIDSARQELESEKKEIVDKISSEQKIASNTESRLSQIEKMRYGSSADSAKKKCEENLKELGDLLNRIGSDNTSFSGDFYSAINTDVSNIKHSIDTSNKKKEFFDDNGCIYRENNQLVPNSEFVVNGYTYKTDEEGRVVSAEGKLHLKDDDYNRNMEDVKKIDGQNYGSNDDRGHLIAHRFGGSDRLENLLPMNSNLNRVDYNKMEKLLEDAVKDNAVVYLKVEPLFHKDSTRPYEFKVSFSVDGDEKVVYFLNESEDTI